MKTMLDDAGKLNRDDLDPCGSCQHAAGDHYPDPPEDCCAPCRVKGCGCGDYKDPELDYDRDEEGP